MLTNDDCVDGSKTSSPGGFDWLVLVYLNFYGRIWL